ncbi:MAG: alpha/beta hydrolase [Pseudomonadota bacterium]
MDPLPLPSGITSRQIATDAGLDQHFLEAGDPTKPLLLLLHGFPELAFSWRHVMTPLAEAGYWVIAPDQRGYGRTTGWTPGYDIDLSEYSIPNRVRDAVALIRALGRERVDGLLGHDYGAQVARWAALIRPDVFLRTATMSSPFLGAPAIARRRDPTHDDMLALDRPRKHYQWYYSERRAAGDMENAPQGVHDFLRAYFHMKSADWAGNAPFALDRWDAENLAKMPTYYIMDAAEDMAETVAHHMPSGAQIAACTWMTPQEMEVYAAEYTRTGFQGALNSYRCGTSAAFNRDLSLYSGAQIKGPFMFIAGQQDWGWAQVPGAIAAMEGGLCADYRGTHLIDGAGHWVQQEKPDEVVRLVLDFMA